jgi:hypothetical protein
MQSYLCKCTLHPEGHLVQKSNKIIHLLEVQQLQTRQVGLLATTPTMELLTHTKQDTSLVCGMDNRTVAEGDIQQAGATVCHPPPSSLY